MRKLASALALVLSASILAVPCAFADVVKIRPDAPERYVVKRGDTLWGISGKFLRDPWKWPEVWRNNQNEIEDPHWIYPGDVVVFDPSTNSLHIERGGKEAHPKIALTPGTRITLNEDSPIPSIPVKDIEPFLTRTMIIDPDTFNHAPRVIAFDDGHEIAGTGQSAYAMDLPNDKGLSWQLYRPMTEVHDLDTNELLGYEIDYVGDAKVRKFGSPATLNVVSSTQESYVADRLFQFPVDDLRSYVPHGPKSDITGRVIGAHGALSEMGLSSVITLNRGTRDGVDGGTVLAIYETGTLVHETPDADPIKLPDERTGLVFVFRSFERVSYGLIVQSQRSIHIGDTVKNP